MPTLLTNETLQDLLDRGRAEFFPELEKHDIRIGVSLGHPDFIDTHYFEKVYSISVSQDMLTVGSHIILGGIYHALATILIQHQRPWYIAWIPINPKLTEQIAQQILIDRDLDNAYADYIALIAAMRRKSLQAFIKKTQCFLEPVEASEIDELFTRREKLQHLAPRYDCPACKEQSVFPIKFTIPAAWRCNQCEHEFSFEPE